jgi:hypothetical protein
MTTSNRSDDSTLARTVASRTAIMALPLLFISGAARVLEIIPKLIEKLAFLE